MSQALCFAPSFNTVMHEVAALNLDIVLGSKVPGALTISFRAANPTVKDIDILCQGMDRMNVTDCNNIIIPL